MNKKLENTRRLGETLEAEQERIARDLHDELSGNLAALQVQIHASVLPMQEKIPIQNILTESAQTARQITEQLCLSIYTVETHRKNIMGKIGNKKPGELMQYILEQGLTSA